MILINKDRQESMKKLYALCILTAIAMPAIVLAAEEKSAFHMFYEKTFGPVGAIAGIIAMVAMWQLSTKVEKNLQFALRMFVAVLLFVNIGSISFGIHGSGFLDGETSRYIERVCRLIALLLADVAALVLFLRIGKKEEMSQPTNTPEVN